MSDQQHLYKIQFINQGKVYEIYARSVGASSMLGFIEIGELVFGEKSSLVLDPGEESLKHEFANVQRSFIPMHAVIRIDEVNKRGIAKVTETKTGEGKVTHLPFPIINPTGDSSK